MQITSNNYSLHGGYKAHYNVWMPHIVAVGANGMNQLATHHNSQTRHTAGHHEWIVTGEWITGWWYTYPFEKWWSESQLGWWNSQLNGIIRKIIKFHGSKPPTRLCISILKIYIYFVILGGCWWKVIKFHGSKPPTRLCISILKIYIYFMWYLVDAGGKS